MKHFALLSAALLSSLAFTGCQDLAEDVAPRPQTASADAKKVTTYQAVSIDLIGVEVSQDTDENTSNWTALPGVQPGRRNLLQTGNIGTPLFVTGAFQTGTLKQLRLILGPNSTITLSDGRILPLDTPSGQTSGLKVKLNAAVTSGTNYAVLVPIDPDWQVVARGNGSYGLKPVLEGTVSAQQIIIITPGGGGGPVVF
ncbi:DUF4382 domain-containing protein [Hymenobacter persicinus]|uniref:DUF4382 domain-containing protein n=1 Tax=Hymenobacter persicinus TaxID=2025506 RepID=A0A4Q5LCW1_9BACT|nr:DUF4382 domain-containing protein [Hymenobacter persicinus]RYU81067.1 DUF4382 domain-containing protein [Hymenobacter persicinus]